MAPRRHVRRPRRGRACRRCRLVARVGTPVVGHTARRRRVRRRWRGGCRSAPVVPVALIAGALVSAPVTAWTAARPPPSSISPPSTKRDDAAVLAGAMQPAGGFCAAGAAAASGVTPTRGAGARRSAATDPAPCSNAVGGTRAAPCAIVRMQLRTRQRARLAHLRRRVRGSHIDRVARPARGHRDSGRDELVVVTVNVIVALITMAAVPWAGTRSRLARGPVVRSQVGE